MADPNVPDSRKENPYFDLPSEEDIKFNRYGEVKKAPRLVQHILTNVAPRFADRDGGYTRIIKTGRHRLGDGADLVLLQLVGEEEGSEVTSDTMTGRRRQADRREAFAASLGPVAATETEEAPVEEAPVEEPEAVEETPVEEPAAEAGGIRRRGFRRGRGRRRDRREGIRASPSRLQRHHAAVPRGRPCSLVGTLRSMSNEIDQLQLEAIAALEAASDPQAVEAWRIEYLGSKGRLKDMMSRTGDLPAEERPVFGRA